MSTDTPDFEARARDIVNGYGYLCADRMNDWNILQFSSIVSAALLQAFEEGKLCERKIAIGEPIDLDKAFGCQATVTAGGTASSSASPPLHPDGGGDADSQVIDGSGCVWCDLGLPIVSVNERGPGHESKTGTIYFCTALGKPE